MQGIKCPMNALPDTPDRILKDVDYCIEQANDWRDSIGDYRDDTPNENNTVFIEELN